MDMLAAIFGLFITAASVVLAYRWGVKPEREEKKLKAEQAKAEMHRQHWERLRRRSAG